MKGFTLIELLICIIILFLLPCFPLIFIWAINTLFGLTIQYTLLNWFAALVLLLMGGAFKVSWKTKTVRSGL